MLSPSVLNSVFVPRCSRICFLVRLIMPWRLPDCAKSTFPVPVTLKRFLAPDFVFSLGIWLSCGRHGFAGREARSAGDVLEMSGRWSWSLWDCAQQVAATAAL